MGACDLRVLSLTALVSTQQLHFYIPCREYWQPIDTVSGLDWTASTVLCTSSAFLCAECLEFLDNIFLFIMVILSGLPICLLLYSTCQNSMSHHLQYLYGTMCSLWSLKYCIDAITSQWMEAQQNCLMFSVHLGVPHWLQETNWFRRKVTVIVGHWKYIEYKMIFFFQQPQYHWKCFCYNETFIITVKGQMYFVHVPYVYSHYIWLYCICLFYIYLDFVHIMCIPT